MWLRQPQSLKQTPKTKDHAMTHSLVTGAGHRLGRAMALYLAGRGHDVAVHYASSAQAAQTVVAEIKAMGRNAVALQADLLDEDQMQSLLPRAVKALGGPIDCLVNNASIFEHDSIDTASRASWDRHMGSNLRAPFVLTQAMAAQELEPAIDDFCEPYAAGLIVNMVDQRVRKLTPDFMTYTLAKMGLWTLTQTSARALAPRIRVNAIAKQSAATVLKRGSNPTDITAALGYFLDAPAVTGQLICTDGGQHLGWETPDVIGVE
jgi:NAD(P)-dependent dehydrogenase (short-subunit alcohol dehydrogenase family)